TLHGAKGVAAGRWLERQGGRQRKCLRPPDPVRVVGQGPVVFQRCMAQGRNALAVRPERQRVRGSGGRDGGGIHERSGPLACGRVSVCIQGWLLGASTRASPSPSSTASNLSRRTEPLPFSKRDNKSTETPLREAASS